METIRVALVGCGGRQQAHMEAFESMDNVKVVAVADPVAERREKAAKRFGVDKVYENHSALYDNAVKDGVEMASICIEPTAHSDTELRAIDLGIPFMVEKPMTMNPALGDEIVKKAAEKNLLTSVGFQDRYLDLIDIIKDELPKHKQGGLVYGAWIGGIPGVWWWQKKSTCGGQLVEQNIHLLDGLRYLFGEPLSVYATCSRGIVRPGVDASNEYDTDDHSTAVIRFANSVTATLVSACYMQCAQATSGYLITLNDMVLDYRLRNNLIIKTDRETRDIKRGNNQTTDLERAFVKAILTGDKSLIRSPYEDALKTLKLGFAANESMETGKVINF